jgi:hypothetical protein
MRVDDKIRTAMQHLVITMNDVFAMEKVTIKISVVSGVTQRDFVVNDHGDAVDYHETWSGYAEDRLQQVDAKQAFDAIIEMNRKNKLKEPSCQK